MDRIYERRQGFEWVHIGICGFVDRTGEILENAPDSIREVEIERVKIMDFGDGMDVMPL